MYLRWRVRVLHRTQLPQVQPYYTRLRPTTIDYTIYTCAELLRNATYTQFILTVNHSGKMNRIPVLCWIVPPLYEPTLTSSWYCAGLYLLSMSGDLFPSGLSTRMSCIELCIPESCTEKTNNKLSLYHRSIEVNETQYLPPANEVCEGYVFTPVCPSVHRGGVCLSACWDTQPPPAVHAGRYGQ